MVYMKVKISAVTDKELLVNPNCPVKLLYNYIQSELVAANAKKPFSESKVALTGSMSLASAPKREESNWKGLIRHRSSSKSSTGNRSISKTSSIVARQDMPSDQQYDLVDDKGTLKQIYNLDPWVNGWETGIFIDGATYFVVIFDRDDKGSMINLQIMLPKHSKHYSDMLSKVRRQSRVFAKQRVMEEKA